MFQKRHVYDIGGNLTEREYKINTYRSGSFWSGISNTANRSDSYQYYTSTDVGFRVLLEIK